nr:leucine-rich repeat protein [Tanacetum cinerariifolium]
NLSRCSNLEDLWLAENKLAGSIPKEMSLLSKLSRLVISKNNLTGGISPFFGNITSMKVFGVSENPLGGSIPDTLGLWKSLKEFDARVLPISMGNLSDQLAFLDLGENQLFGSLPSGIGPIPDAIGNLSLLNRLYLNSNKLEGLIPPSLGNCKELNGLNLRHNKLKIKYLKMLSGLDLSYNNLSGTITSSLGECISLTMLYLRGNIFHGIIPSSLSSLGGLSVLDISKNNLSGKIPQFLDKWKSLEFLNLSFNDFEGEVPLAGVFANASAFLVLGNNRLCDGLVTLGLHKCKETGSKEKRFPFFVLFILIAPTLLVVLCGVYLLCKKKCNSQPSQSSGNERFLKVSYNELLKATNGFSIENLIGEGGFSYVYKGILDSYNDRFVAIKVLHLQNRGAHKSFLAECEAWRNIRHCNLLKIITSCSSVDFQGNDFKAMVYEFMSNGSVHDWLHSTGSVQMWPGLAGYGRVRSGSGRGLRPGIAGGLDQVLPVMTGYGRVWPVMAGLGWLWLGLAGYGRVLAAMAGSGRL